MQRRVWQTIGTTLLSLAAACAGTSTGNPFDPPDEGGPSTAEGGGFCEGKPRDLASLDAESPLGFSAADVLALAAGPIEVDLQWPNAQMLEYGPESGTSKLLIELTPRGDKPRFNDRSPKMSSGGAGPAIDIGSVGPGSCPDQLEIDVSVHFKTAGGAFDERFDATLIAGSTRFARLYQSLPAAKLQGEFDARLGNAAASELESLQFSMSFSELGATGDMYLGFTLDSGSGGASASRAATQLPFARWPAGSTCRDGIDSTLDRKLGAFNARDGIELINRASLQLQAANASPTRLSLQLTAASDKLCVSGLDDASGPSMVVPGTIRVRTEDQLIDGSWPVHMKLESTPDGQLRQAELNYDQNGGIVALMVAASSFESTFGVHGISLGAYTQGAAFIHLVQPADGAASGKIEIWGAGPSRCMLPPPQPEPDSRRGSSSSPGCSGIDLGPVLELPINPL